MPVAFVLSPKSHKYDAIVPSASEELLPLKDTLSGASPEVGVALIAATGGWLPLPAGITKRVMLCCGRVALKLLLLKLMSERWLIVFDEVNCQTCAVPPFAKFATLIVAGVLPLRYLLITITVNAPSAERVAEKAETLSGLGTVVETLVSPNVDLLPS